MNVPYFDLKAQYSGIREEILAALDGVCRSASFSSGPEVVEFEREFATYCDVKHCVALNTGTSALHLALLIVGGKPRLASADPVMAAAALACGADVVLSA